MILLLKSGGMLLSNRSQLQCYPCTTKMLIWKECQVLISVQCAETAH